MFFQFFGASFAKFNVNQALATASVTQHDLKQDYYGGQAFDIGAFDGTPQRAIELFPAAVFAGVFRPTLIESSSPLMLLSAIENTYLMFLLLRVLFYSINPYKIIRNISKEPIVATFLLYSVLFAFLIGLSTSNFGALVRFKIPLIPFYASAMVILRLKLKESVEMKRQIKLLRNHSIKHISAQ